MSNDVLLMGSSPTDLSREENLFCIHFTAQKLKRPGSAVEKAEIKVDDPEIYGQNLLQRPDILRRLDELRVEESNLRSFNRDWLVKEAYECLRLAKGERVKTSHSGQKVRIDRGSLSTTPQLLQLMSNLLDVSDPLPTPMS